MTKLRKLDLTIAFDYRKPLVVRAAVQELKARMDSETWAMMESLAIEVCRQSALDLETVYSVAQLAAERTVPE